MKTEVLRDIKKTEEEYQKTITAAQEEKKHRHSQAELEADNLVTKAQSNAEQYKKLKLEEARHQAALKARRNHKKWQSKSSGNQGKRFKEPSKSSAAAGSAVQGAAAC